MRHIPRLTRRQRGILAGLAYAYAGDFDGCSVRRVLEAAGRLGTTTSVGYVSDVLHQFKARDLAEQADTGKRGRDASWRPTLHGLTIVLAMAKTDQLRLTLTARELIEAAKDTIQQVTDRELLTPERG